MVLWRGSEYNKLISDQSQIFINNMFTNNLDNGGRIPVSHLSEGMYIIRIVQGSKVRTGKVLIE